jgi:hypothetical protein
MRAGHAITDKRIARKHSAFGISVLVCVAACTSPASTSPARTASADTARVAPPPMSSAALQRPLPFQGRAEVSVAEWLQAVEAEIDPIAASPTVRADYDRLLARHGLPRDDALYADYVRVRVAFEATRAGGLWGLEWRVTDQLPQSDRIWAQWRTARATGANLPTTTAIAECDELSALFAVVARGIGLSRRSRVGLLWPTSNQTGKV